MQVVHHVTWGAEGEGHGIHKARLSCASQGPASRTLALLDGSVWVSCSCALRCHLPDTPHPEGLFLEGHPCCRPPPCLPPFEEKLYLVPREACRPRLAWGLWGQSSEAGLTLLGLPFHFDLSRLHFGPVQRALLQAPWGLGVPLSRAQGLGKWLTWPPLVLKGGMCLGEPARGRHKVGVQVCPDHAQALGFLWVEPLLPGVDCLLVCSSREMVLNCQQCALRQRSTFSGHSTTEESRPIHLPTGPAASHPALYPLALA